MSGIRTDLKDRFNLLGFDYLYAEDASYVFHHKTDSTCIIIDHNIFTLQEYKYVDYTSSQNRLFHQYDRVFRFLLDGEGGADEVLEELHFFLSGGDDPEKIRRFGRNRTEQDIDPTRPEATFEDCFIEAFGALKRGTLHREYSYIDCIGKERFVDYALFTRRQKFAIELNGECFHHPVLIGPAKYRSQLFKQNSLAADGFKVFRWSLNGMRNTESFIQELNLFFGNPSDFKDIAHLRFKRGIETIKLKRHQKNALSDLAKGRADGRRSFLLVLPTGTGKTEIFIKDIENLKNDSPNLKALVIVPTRKLRDQTIARLKLRIPKYRDSIGTDFSGPDAKDIAVQTSAYMHRHYYKAPQDCFDYIIVDEAHHAAAMGLRKILEHFVPEHLLGLTATPERFDQQKLEEIFGEYESSLSLEKAIEDGLVPPVRCFRVQSEIDLSEVRFNGKDYVKTDLQRSLRIPSRDELIAKIINQYFSGELASKQGVVFCVDINHAKRMTNCLNEHQIPALAVNGRDRIQSDKAILEYMTGSVRFLCACDLLTEGWDAPQTSILVMARPTFSKVLYTQQLGRGLRLYPGKEALYVIDVVDNYGAKLQPLSLHAVFGINSYRPFEDLLKAKGGTPDKELMILDGLYEGIRRVEPVNIFNFEKMYGDYLNEEQLARALFVSTGTVKAWLKKKKISADYTHPFGRQTLCFFKPEQITEIRDRMGLSEHTEETRKDDFMEFLENRDYMFSYKIIFLLGFLKIRNKRGEAKLPDLLKLYRDFYQHLFDKYNKNEKANCPYNRSEYLYDAAGMQQNLLQNPFEKFERKRFFYHCRDLNYIGLDITLRDRLTENDYKKITSQMVEDLKAYYEKLEIPLTQENYAFLLDQEEPAATDSKAIFSTENPAQKVRFIHFLPLYPLSIAAGSFMDSSIPTEPEGWIDMRNVSSRRHFDESMFVARVHGRSMEPVIKDGDYCLFTTNTVGTRNGKIVLAQKSDFMDQDTGASYTVKRYQSKKIENPDYGWVHETITLYPLNPDYNAIEIPPEEAEKFNIIAFLIEVLR